MKYESTYARLLANSDGPPEGQNENGCWPWTGQLKNSNYGTMSVRVPGVPSPRKVYAHRAMAQALRDQDAQLAADDALPGLLCAGPVTAPPMHPDDETVEHLCCWRRCTNPDHQITLTRAENTRAMQMLRKAAKNA